MQIEDSVEEGLHKKVDGYIEGVEDDVEIIDKIQVLSISLSGIFTFVFRQFRFRFQILIPEADQHVFCFFFLFFVSAFGPASYNKIYYFVNTKV